jgi:hypothetical protein
MDEAGGLPKKPAATPRKAPSQGSHNPKTPAIFMPYPNRNHSAALRISVSLPTERIDAMMAGMAEPVNDFETPRRLIQCRSSRIERGAVSRLWARDEAPHLSSLFGGSTQTEGTRGDHAISWHRCALDLHSALRRDDFSPFVGAGVQVR